MKRTDIQTVLVVGAGPIVIGQACEFDYSGTQACKALRREGYRVVLVNSNPATIMTDPEFADVTYIEPLAPGLVERIIEAERPDALLATVGGQTALNLAMDLHHEGVLAKHGVELLGASPESIALAEDRDRFRRAMVEAGLAVPEGGVATSLDEAWHVSERVGFPCLVRPSFTLGGSGGGVARSAEDFAAVVEHGLRESPVHQVLVEQSVEGWKEFELEVMQDGAGNFVVVCTIENVDAMGVHTGDSITVAPAQTLSDREYQQLRDMARQVMAAVGIATGGANVQFAVNPADGQAVVIEMNPRVSRSSALASKATGFPIAKIAALVAVGYRLDELQNDITRVTPASFEPSIDYTVVKVPRWNFEKFPGADPTLGPQMKSVGEVMAIGRTFSEALGKALAGLELGSQAPSPAIKTGRSDSPALPPVVDPKVGGTNQGDGRTWQLPPTPTRLFEAMDALRRGASANALAEATGYDPWFVDGLLQIVETEAELASHSLTDVPAEVLWRAKRMGLTDRTIGLCLGPDPVPAIDVRRRRLELGVRPTFLAVDTCAAEFEAHTPYLYSTYETEEEAPPTTSRKVVILGGGPNRIGQGIEFDYCCVQACRALSEVGCETIMVNCNPETVSTDYDTADRLYFEPVTLEHVLNVLDREQPDGVIVQLGGQTPINLAQALAENGAPIWGTPAEAIALAEDRGRFGELLRTLDIPAPAWGSARSLEEAEAIAERVGYPVLVRPSFVLGGRAMEIVYDEASLAGFLAAAQAVAPDQPVLVDHYLEDAFEVDVDAVADGERVVIAGVMQHIEEAGIHSGDSACVLPPYKISAYHEAIMRDYTERLGLALGVRGLMNVQFAVKDDVVYVLEVNPRASRTVPFVSKATGVPVARIAAQVMAGATLAELGFVETPVVDGFFVKEVVLPFRKFPGAAVWLGPEMRSTGEVMGHASTFGHAFAKAMLAAGQKLPKQGSVLLTVNDYDKGAVMKIARDLVQMGFTLLATHGTAASLERVGLPCEGVNKVSEGSPHTVDRIAGGDVSLVINTPLGRTAYEDTQAMRAAAILHGVPLVTTLSAAAAAVSGIRALKARELRVRSLQAHFAANGPGS